MFTYRYKGHWNCESICGVEIERDGIKAIVVLTELEENQGTSVTNMVEKIATQIYLRFLDVPYWNITWIEHYPEIKFRKKETFDKVTLEWDGKKSNHPEEWRRASYVGRLGFPTC